MENQEKLEQVNKEQQGEVSKGEPITPSYKESKSKSGFFVESDKNLISTSDKDDIVKGYVDYSKMDFDVSFTGSVTHEEE